MAAGDVIFADPPVTGSPVDLVFGGGAVASVPEAPAPGDLLFSQLQMVGSPVDLVFGDDGASTPVPALVTATLAGVLDQPVLQGLIRGGPVIVATLAGTLPALPALSGWLDVRTVSLVTLAGALPQPPLSLQLTAAYLSNTARPTVGQSAAPWQVATHGEDGIQNAMQRASATPSGVQASWMPGLPAPASTDAAHTEAQRYQSFLRTLFQDAAALGTQPTAGQNQDADRSPRPTRSSGFQQGNRTPSDALRSWHQDGLRDRRSALSQRWQQARPSRTGYGGKVRTSQKSSKTWQGPFQEAMHPPAGQYVPPVVVVPFEPCYLPSPHLLFDAPWAADGNLVFICERHIVTPPVSGETVVVPIKRVYMTINSITLHRVDGNTPIPAYAFSMSLDADSWTWNWSATLPLDALPLIEPASNGDPVEVEVLVNGIPCRLLCESVGSQRQFGQARITVKGRGKAAILDAPYAPIINHGNVAPRTAQQLMTDVLTVNGVGIGWSVDWGLTDWLVPGNVWTHQGAYISAINAIAQAAGGYAQPHDTAPTLRILPRYPAAPWDWNSVTPDFELPSSVVSVEGTDWQRKAAYNRVFVSGIKGGVLGQVTRAGTAGDSVAAMVTDALITHAVAARQRGLAILSDTGVQARVSLKLQVLPETGLITPGKFVRYTQGGQAQLGLVRSTSLEWSSPRLRQTISLETHQA